MPDQFPTIEAERVPLQQVFMNLIGNAIKFGAACRRFSPALIKWSSLAHDDPCNFLRTLSRQ
jgi:signal transduction histidine kinase